MKLNDGGVTGGVTGLLDLLHAVNDSIAIKNQYIFSEDMVWSLFDEKLSDPIDRDAIFCVSMLEDQQNVETQFFASLLV